jgi:cytochrome c-type biogenesis protein
VRSLSRHAHRLQQVLGLFVIATAVAVYYQYDTVVTVWLSDFYPNATMGL